MHKLLRAILEMKPLLPLLLSFTLTAVQESLATLVHPNASKKQRHTKEDQMFLNKRSVLAISLPLLLLTLLLAACGNSTTANSPTPTPTRAATPTPTATPLPASTFGVKTAKATVNGKAETILTNEEGLTLYYYKPDTANSVKCSGTCEQNWPALLYKGTGMPTSTAGLPGTLSVFNGANGLQVEYQGHPLYTFKKDTKPGETNGEGKSGVWYVATTTLTAESGNLTPTPTTGNGYGY
jgi:predicted lipoprotein with Yx(FWY)xxD motif